MVGIAAAVCTRYNIIIIIIRRHCARCWFFSLLLLLYIFISLLLFIYLLLFFSFNGTMSIIIERNKKETGRLYIIRRARKEIESWRDGITRREKLL